MLLGISLIPVLSLQLLPSSRSNDLSVSFSWDNAGPELLEMEVTTKLEGALARTRGLREIVSETGNGWGTIRLSIDKEENIDAIKLYLGSVVRSVKSGFPEGVQVSRRTVIRDLWRHKDLGSFSSGYSTTLQPHSCRVLRIHPGRGKSRYSGFLSGCSKN